MVPFVYDAAFFARRLLMDAKGCLVFTGYHAADQIISVFYR